MLVFSHFRNGVGATSSHMNVNGLGAPIYFDYVAVDPIFWAERVNIDISDGAILADGFGGRAALTNGLTLKYHDSDDSVLLDFLDGLVLKENHEWSHLAGVDVDRDTQVGNTDDSLIVRWTIAKAGAPLKMVSGQYLRVTVQDDLSDLTHYEMNIQGVSRG